MYSLEIVQAGLSVFPVIVKFYRTGYALGDPALTFWSAGKRCCSTADIVLSVAPIPKASQDVQRTQLRGRLSNVSGTTVDHSEWIVGVVPFIRCAWRFNSSVGGENSCNCPAT